MAAAGLDPDNKTAEETASFEAVFSALEGPLLAYAYKLVRQIESAQDIVQEAFIKYHDHRETVEMPKPWLYRTVHNLALNHQRANRKIVPLIQARNESEKREQDVEDGVPQPDESLVRMEMIIEARELVDELSERQQELIKLKFERGLSYREIAEEMELSVSNVGYLLHQTLKRLSNELSKKGRGE